MAKSISNPNIAVTVATGEVKPKIDGVNKALGDLSSKPLVELKQGFEKNLGAINKDIRSTVENLYKLRAELAKGGDTSKLTQQLKNQLGKIDKGTTGGKGGDGGKALEEAGKTANDLLGGKFDLGKAAKFGVVGIVGSIVSDLAAGITDALVEVGNNPNAGFGDYAKAIGQQLPIIGGIVKTVENIDELWTGNRKAVEDYNKQIALADTATKTYRDTLKAVADQRDAFNLSVGKERRTYEAGQLGGVEGRIARANAEYENAAATIAAEAQKRKDAIDEKLAKDVAAQEKGVPAGGASGRQASAAASARSAAEQNKKLLKAAADMEKAEIERQATERLGFEGKKREDTVNVATGMRPQLAAAMDSLEALKKQTEAMDGDPFKAMRKSFESLAAGSTLLEEFDKELAVHKKRLEEVAEEAKKFNATKTAEDIVKNGPNADRLIGLSAIDRQIEQMRIDGVDDADLLRKVKITLETTEAKQQAEDLKKVVEGIGANIKVTLARDTKSRIAAEIEGESLARGPGKGYSDEQKAELQAAREDQAAASSAAATREAVKLPAEKLQEGIEGLKEQFRRGYISEDELKRGVGQQLQQYADSMRTSRPELMEAGSAAAQQMMAIESGGAIDASRPELVIAREQTDLLGEIRDAVRERRATRVPIAG